MTAQTPSPILTASDGEMRVLAIRNDAEGRAIMRQLFPRPVPKPQMKPVAEQVAEMRERAKTDPVLLKLFPSLGEPSPQLSASDPRMMEARVEQYSRERSA